LVGEVHPSKVKLTFFRDGNGFLIASTVSEEFSPANVAKGGGGWQHKVTS
jgi:hypothetical protein